MLSTFKRINIAKNVFKTKKVKTQQQQNKKSNKKPCQSRGQNALKFIALVTELW